jgi:hypothetical protein
LKKTRPRNRWQDEVREDARIVGGEEWQGKVYNREEWKKLLRTARNCRIVHINGTDIDVLCAAPCGRTVYGLGLRPLAGWVCGFETHGGHGCLSVVTVVSCKVRGVCVGLITHPEYS